MLQKLEWKIGKEKKATLRETEGAAESNLVITIHKLLLAKTDKLPGGKEICTFQGPSCAETPAWSAWTLFPRNDPKQ